MEYVKFCENCTILMVPCFVPYDRYREEKAILKECKRDTHPVDAENETKFWIWFTFTLKSGIPFGLFMIIGCNLVFGIFFP